MPKINQEEYEVLKGLGNTWKWIARDKDGVLGVYDAKVVKTKFHNFWVMAIKKKIDLTLFNFIQWEDEEPYNITELVEEYESEETEVKNIEWLKERVISRKKSAELNVTAHREGLSEDFESRVIAYESVLKLINQLDEPEVLSQKWISENVEYAYFDMLDGSGRLSSATAVIKPKKLQNIFVPKQELPAIPKFVADYLCRAKADVTLMRVLEIANTRDELPEWKKEYDWISANDETFARAWLDGFTVEREQKYILSISITDKASKTNYKTYLNKRGIFHSMENESFNSEEFNWSEEEIKDLENGEILFEHFAVKVEEMEECYKEQTDLK